jgi:hypothetical protein
MFQASSLPSSGAQQLQQQTLVLPSERSDSSAVGRSRADRSDHDQQHCYHHAPTVKPEAATAVVELLKMGVRTPETCWAVHKRQLINLRNCCIWLVDLFGAYENVMWRGMYSRCKMFVTGSQSIWTHCTVYIIHVLRCWNVVWIYKNFWKSMFKHIFGLTFRWIRGLKLAAVKLALVILLRVLSRGIRITQAKTETQHQRRVLLFRHRQR